MGSKIIKKNSHPDLHNVTMSFVSSRVVTQCTRDWWDMLLPEPSGSTEGEDGVGGWQTGRSFTLPASGCPENQRHRTLSLSDFTNSNTLKKCKFGYCFFMKHTFWDSCSLVHHKTNKESKKEKKEVVNPPQLGCGVPGWFYHIMSSAEQMLHLLSVELIQRLS